MSIDNLQLLVKKRFLRSASLSHPHIPKQRSHPHIPKQRSHSHTPKAIPTERFAIAPHTSQTAIALPQTQEAIALPISPKRSHPPHPKSDRIPTSQTANCLQQRLRYRTSSTPPKSDRSPTSPNPKIAN
ncbi:MULTISPECIES: hypothetical protein [Nostocales]|uniref:Uncharacterized protein n=1 Tax=Dolichospermum flos-aquae UHCC 0037 TaxID=2590026 RepID=A0ACC7S4R6_DOLFA|nr:MULTISPECIES: hypothetical protein [Nostocales]MBO1064597.1 hypothetical protein [Anabaena sp. 54]MTJ43465.1 hypothetical protein [Dolichospermum flos-aquae UHCC 0037]